MVEPGKGRFQIGRLQGGIKTLGRTQKQTRHELRDDGTRSQVRIKYLVNNNNTLVPRRSFLRLFTVQFKTIFHRLTYSLFYFQLPRSSMDVYIYMLQQNFVSLDSLLKMYF